MNFRTPTLLFVLAAAATTGAFGQQVLPPEDFPVPVSGSYVVSLLSSAFQREKCAVSTSASVKIPRLGVVEQAAARPAAT